MGKPLCQEGTWPAGRDAVRIHFQERPWDLVVAIGYTLIMSTVLLGSDVGNLLAILLVLFVPGYVLVAALFPSNKELDWIERIALSFGLSIAVVPLLGLLLNFTPWGIRFAPIVATIATFTILVGLAAWWRRMRLPEAERLAATLVLSMGGWKDYTLVDRLLTIALAASIVIAAGALAYVVLVPRPGETFTEFYLLGPGGNASGYPTKLNRSQPGTVIIGVINHEAATVSYTVRVDLVGVTIVFNTTCGCNQTRELNRTTRSWFNATIGDGRNWTNRFTFSINASALWKVQFLLYRDTNLTNVYRELHLFVRVS